MPLAACRLPSVSSQSWHPTRWGMVPNRCSRGTTMLSPAHVGHLPILRALIRDGAARGSFDRELATDSAEAAQFFSNLRRALTTGYFIEKSVSGGHPTTVAVPGYVYLPERGGALTQPIGFGLFKTIDLGYELWLTGVDPAWRGH